MIEDFEVHNLVSRAQAGEVAAFEALYHHHQAGIFSFVLSQVRNHEQAADLTQDTFVRAWQSLRKLRTPGAFRGWLHQIAANLVRDAVKSGYMRKEFSQSSFIGEDEEGTARLEPADDSFNPEMEAISAEMKRTIWSALEELNPDQRAAVVMHHLEGMSVSEIAHALGTKPGTIMSRLARAREVLRQRLAPLVEETDGPVRAR